MDIFSILFNMKVSCVLSLESPDRGDSNVVVVVALLFYVHGKHLRSCWYGQLT